MVLRHSIPGPCQQLAIDPARRETGTMRFPNDTAFHMKMAALVIVSLFVEHNAKSWLPNWSSPQIGVITFVLGLAWVTLFAAHHAQALQERDTANLRKFSDFTPVPIDLPKLRV